MVERIILLSAAALVGLLFLYALLNAPPQGGQNFTDGMAPEPPANVWFQEEVIEEESLVLVDFKADWCGPCKMLHPHLVKLKEKYAGRIKIVELDVVEHQDIANHYNVDSIPLVLLYVDGKIVDGFRGYRDYVEIEELALHYMK